MQVAKWTNGRSWEVFELRSAAREEIESWETVVVELPVIFGCIDRNIEVQAKSARGFFTISPLDDGGIECVIFAFGILI